MSVRVLLLADTHVPKRARDLPAEVWQAVDAADVVVHRLPVRRVRTPGRRLSR